VGAVIRRTVPYLRVGLWVYGYMTYCTALALAAKFHPTGPLELGRIIPAALLWPVLFGVRLIYKLFS
jgi:hypothetical protein